MTVFVSCSGALSNKVANLLHAWLPDVNQSVETWLYSEDIEKGSRWPDEVNKALATTVGILCVTQENKDAPWLLFEAGALSKGLEEARVCPLLIDLERRDVKGPLAHFTFTLPNKEEMWKLLKTINHADREKELREERLLRYFTQAWPEFEKRFQQIREAHQKEAKPPQRSVEDMVAEILDRSRVLQRNSEQLLELSTQQAPAILEGSSSGYSGYSPHFFIDEAQAGTAFVRQAIERLKEEDQKKLAEAIAKQLTPEEKPKERPPEKPD